MTGAVKRQPFLDNDDRLVAVFNGEIYNWMGLVRHCLLD